MGAAVGIDLGTTYSVVARIGRDGRPQVLKNDYGSATTPSAVYVAADGALEVGEEARRRLLTSPDDVATYFKRHMGEEMFEYVLRGREYTPVDLSAQVLAALKATAQRDLGEPVTDAVITVPAYFMHAQREDTKLAGRRAGLNVLDIINEPSAAARAYGFKPGGPEQTLLVYDLGGGTFDVSIVRITADAIEVVATDGDSRLGGRDWDERIVLYLASQWSAASPGGSEPLDAFETVQDLWAKAEEAKRSLSAREEVRVQVSHEGVTHPITINRDTFEELTRGLIERTEMLCDAALREAGLRWADLAGVLPVGGSSRMPAVRERIQRMSGKPPLTGVNPDEAVAIGAAITAALAVETSAGRQIYALPGRKRVQDVTAHSLGMIAESEDGSRYVNSRLIARNSAIPNARTRPYTIRAAQNGPTTLTVFVTQGESDDPQACAYPQAYAVTGFPDSASGGTFRVDVTYRYEADGTIAVEAQEAHGARLTVTPGPVPPDVPARFLAPPGAGFASTAEPVTLYLAFDLSGSMRGEPLAEAKKAAHAFVSNTDLSTTSIGLISFSDTVAVDQPATRDNASIERAIDELAIGKTGRGNLAHPFHEILQLLGNKPGHNYALILADGVWVGQRRAKMAARLCHQAGVKIIAIGFGKADELFLDAIRSADERAFFIDLEQLTSTFSDIARELRQRFSLGGS